MKRAILSLVVLLLLSASAFGQGMFASNLTANTDTVNSKTTLSQNYPNPFNPSTKISFIVAKTGSVSLRVYDMLGRTVAVLVNETLQAGAYTEQFSGVGLSSGVYIYQLQTPEGSYIKKMSLLK